jgi:hypothetical protein
LQRATAFAFINVSAPGPSSKCRPGGLCADGIIAADGAIEGMAPASHTINLKVLDGNG